MTERDTALALLTSEHIEKCPYKQELDELKAWKAETLELVMKSKNLLQALENRMLRNGL